MFQKDYLILMKIYKDKLFVHEWISLCVVNFDFILKFRTSVWLCLSFYRVRWDWLECLVQVDNLALRSRFMFLPFKYKMSFVILNSYGKHYRYWLLSWNLYYIIIVISKQLQDRWWNPFVLSAQFFSIAFHHLCGHACGLLHVMCNCAEQKP